MAKSSPLIVSVPNNVIIITGRNTQAGKIAFMLGPTVVWTGDINAIPDQIGEYNEIAINRSDYNKIFRSADEPQAEMFPISEPINAPPVPPKRKDTPLEEPKQENVLVEELKKVSIKSRD